MKKNKTTLVLAILMTLLMVISLASCKTGILRLRQKKQALLNPHRKALRMMKIPLQNPKNLFRCIACVS